MEEWRYKAVSITKHKTIIHDNDWHHFGHVGSKVSYIEYKKVEDKYISVILRILHLLSIKEVVVSCTEKRNFTTDNNQELRSTFNCILQNKKVSTDSDFLCDSIRLLLRELIEGSVYTVDNNLVFRFGYDMYMYLNSDIAIEKIDQIAKDFGLFLRT